MATEDNIGPGDENVRQDSKTACHPGQDNGKNTVEQTQNVEHSNASKDTLSQQDIADGVKTFEPGSGAHMALETKEGKNNGALPSAYEGQRSNHP